MGGVERALHRSLAYGRCEHSLDEQAGPCRTSARTGRVVLALAVARGTGGTQPEAVSRTSWERSARGRVRFLPPTSMTVLPLTMWTWAASQLVPARVAVVTALAAKESITMLSPGPPSMLSLPGPPMQDVVARAAEQRVVAVAADEDVVAVAAVQRQLDRAGRHAGCIDDVVAREGVDRQPVVGGLGAGDADPRGRDRSPRFRSDRRRRRGHRRRWCR